jgi:peptide deformylase
MAKLPIVLAPDPVLKAKAKPIAAVDDSISRLMDDMLETMYAAPGIGLAANQIGVLKRVLVLDVAREDDAPQPMGMANPEVVWASEETSVYNEGCLSLPEHYADITRPKEVRVRYLDRDGKRQEIEADGLLATCIQHEIDHLDGVLFVDHLSALKRNMILKKLVKLKKQLAEDGE